MAGKYINIEEKILLEGADKGNYELLDIKKEVTSIDGKKVCTMSYKIKAGSLSSVFKYGLSGRQVGESILNLYFPPDFKNKHSLFIFLIVETKEIGAKVKFDLTLVNPVINSLKIKE